MDTTSKTANALITGTATASGAGKALQQVLSKMSLALPVAFLATGCFPQLDGTDGTNPKPDGTYTAAECKSDEAALPRTQVGYWQPVVLNDVVAGNDYTCADGTDYKFFVQYNEGATDVTVNFEPGGGCWDYETCYADTGVLNPIRLTAVDDNFMLDIDDHPFAFMYPHFGRGDNGVATNKYNHVFFPYCTGDTFVGNKVSDYVNPHDPSIVKTTRHQGGRNAQAAAQWLGETFPSGNTGQLLVLGSSAGAVGTTLNYSYVRDAISPKCSAMVTDAGPIFPLRQSGPNYTPGPQQPMVDIVVERWGLAALTADLDSRLGTPSYRRINRYLGHINKSLARHYPDDRFLFTTYKSDLNFSTFSFVGSGVIPPGTNIADDVRDLWVSEVEHFRDFIDGDRSNNWGYYLPDFRPDFCSHMVSLAPVSLVNDLAYRDAGIAGHADGYLRTELGQARDFQDKVWGDDGSVQTATVHRKVHFGDALRQLLDPSQPLPRLEEVADPNRLTYDSAPGAGVNNDTWYNESADGAIIDDKQAYINSERVRCTRTNGYVFSPDF